MIDLDKAAQNFSKDLSNMSTITAWRVEKQLRGSFADRRPDLGKMVKCPFCGKRRHQFQPEKCCGHSYAIAKDGSTRVNDGLGKAFTKRFKHKRHGQNRMFHIRHQFHLFETSPVVETFYGVPEKPVLDGVRPEPRTPIKVPQAVLQAAQEMHVPLPAIDKLPLFAQKYWLWKQKMAAKQTRKRGARN